MGEVKAGAASAQFLQHLTEVNETQQVIASEDIYNQFGVLLVSKGSRINPQAQRQLQQHRLDKDIDQQIELEQTLTGLELFQLTQSLLEQDPELKRLHHNNRFEDPFRHFCLIEDLPLPLRQKLTIMKQQLPALFEHSLFCGWASTLIAREMKLSSEACRRAYICGLLHDIGMLYLAPELQTQAPLNSDSWRALQSHVVIGQRCLEGLGLHPSIGQGILEHHERLDQTGYPSRKSPDKLNKLGQVVASADMLYNLCSNELNSSDKQVHDALPYFKVHHSSFNAEIHAALMRVLSRAGTPAEDESTPLQPVNLDRVRSVNRQLASMLEPLPPLIEKIGLLDLNESRKLATMMGAINQVLSTSGIADSQLKDWLMADMDPSDPDNHSCLKEIDAMQYELLWLLKRLGWNLDSLLNCKEAASLSERGELELYRQQLQQGLEQGFGYFRQEVNNS
ncbi:HDOD domain-containing protein [Motiliproteus coralliicola]|uniref:HDOD domain-containing protein n=1 Tax=Motiliproteus coralliicola TaxID=2283196 RepID=A0A369WVB3_9GAMM|nr:HD domain-containing phosphohydrolase [Motiliproteus coralliicola]RDE24999.1 HDOD domain-containing protein [Motiliproteus coralliicola]